MTIDGFFAASDFRPSAIARGLDAFDTMRFGIDVFPAFGFALADDAAADFFVTFLIAGFFAASLFVAVFFATVFANGFFAAAFFTAAFAAGLPTAFFAAGLRDAAADFPAEALPALRVATTFFVAVTFFVSDDFFVATDFGAAADERAAGFFAAAALVFAGALVLRDGAGLMSYLQFAGMRESIRSLCPRSALPV